MHETFQSPWSKGLLTNNAPSLKRHHGAGLCPQWVPSPTSGRIWIIVGKLPLWRNEKLSRHQVSLLFYWLAAIQLVLQTVISWTLWNKIPQLLLTKVEIPVKILKHLTDLFAQLPTKQKQKQKYPKHSLVTKDPATLHHCFFSDKLLIGISTLSTWEWIPSHISYVYPMRCLHSVIIPALTRILRQFVG